MLLQAAYTWSKNLTNVNASEPGELDTGQTDFGTSGSNNPLDLRQQWGPDSSQRSQRLIVSYSYSLPWKNAEAGLSGHLMSGWSRFPASPRRSERPADHGHGHGRRHDLRQQR